MIDDDVHPRMSLVEAELAGFQPGSHIHQMATHKDESRRLMNLQRKAIQDTGETHSGLGRLIRLHSAAAQLHYNSHRLLTLNDSEADEHSQFAWGATGDIESLGTPDWLAWMKKFHKEGTLHPRVPCVSCGKPIDEKDVRNVGVNDHMKDYWAAIGWVWCPTCDDRHKAEGK